ncbi:SPOR domain-containing protein [Salinarimonas soli]|uniref:SPOR domain-containing protein n=1 Tax=Salinarimonas soli TaxID=1638099 RepID=A0A5B2VFD7_9HYPH|nr:SPOR domain-containing protein [Salinarimonas soli]KAA2238263.1 SPOR domain-containing protein [Salinarimonas soli]
MPKRTPFPMPLPGAARRDSIIVAGAEIDPDERHLLARLWADLLAWSRTRPERRRGGASRARHAPGHLMMGLIGAFAAAAVSIDPVHAQAEAPEAEITWGVQLAGGFSEAEARALYERARGMLPGSLPVGPPVIERSSYASRGSAPFYRARIDFASQASAIDLCDRIRKAGGSCIVLRMARRQADSGP